MFLFVVKCWSCKSDKVFHVRYQGSPIPILGAWVKRKRSGGVLNIAELVLESNYESG